MSDAQISYIGLHYYVRYVDVLLTEVAVQTAVARRFWYLIAVGSLVLLSVDSRGPLLSVTRQRSRTVLAVARSGIRYPNRESNTTWHEDDFCRVWADTPKDELDEGQAYYGGTRSTLLMTI